MRMTSPRGIPVDRLVLVLQQEICRGHAVLAAYEMHSMSTAHLWRRLRVIAVDDIGMGAPLAPVLLREFQADYDASGRSDWMQVVHAVRYLVSAPKDRTSVEHADLARMMVDAGMAVVGVRTTRCVCTRGRARRWVADCCAGGRTACGCITSRPAPFTPTATR